MLAQVVVVPHVLWKAGFARSEQYTTVRQPSDIFQYIGVFDSGDRRFSPSKGSMPSHQHSGDGDRVKPFLPEPADDYGTGVAHIRLLHFMLGERLRDRNGAMEIIRVRGSQAGNGAAGLWPGGGVLRVRMHVTGQRGERPRG